MFFCFHPPLQQTSVFNHTRTKVVLNLTDEIPETQREHLSKDLLARSGPGKLDRLMAPKQKDVIIIRLL